MAGSRDEASTNLKETMLFATGEVHAAVKQILDGFLQFYHLKNQQAKELQVKRMMSLGDTDLTVEGIQHRLEDADKTLAGIQANLDDADPTIAGIQPKLLESLDRIIGVALKANQALQQTHKHQFSQADSIRGNLLKAREQVSQIKQSHADQTPEQEPTAPTTRRQGNRGGSQ